MAIESTLRSSRRCRSVLVTGASGFVGGEIARRLQNEGYSALGVGRRSLEPIGFGRYKRVDLAADDLGELLEGARFVVHCAGLAHRRHGELSPHDYSRQNEEVTRRVAEAAVAYGAQRFVLISSAAVYASGTTSARETDAPAPSTWYGESKLAAERQASTVCRGGGVGLTILRPATVYGVGDPGNVARLIRALASGRFRSVGDGSNRKSLVHVGDLAGAVLATLNAPTADESRVFNVAGPSVAVSDIVDAIASATGRRTPAALPASVVQAAVGCAASLSFHCGPFERLRRSLRTWLSEDTLDTSAFERQNPHFRWTPFADGIIDEVRWLRRSEPRRHRIAA
ncbi:NAD-dependent epimerase/dehydratase family protein [Botrimarina sp.]|uniref:NAD-dependent epimerase/dehydratase family protein n=1 Tax=Botrimarina sp. TaxID=2795802 RepID=UPI0032EEEDE4